MDDFSEWITERTVMFTSIVGLSGETFDIGDRVFVITLFLIALTVHIVMWLLAPGGSSLGSIMGHNLWLGLDRAKQKGTFDFSQNLIITPSADFKQVSEEF